MKATYEGIRRILIYSIGAVVILAAGWAGISGVLAKEQPKGEAKENSLAVNSGAENEGQIKEVVVAAQQGSTKVQSDQEQTGQSQSNQGDSNQNQKQGTVQKLNETGGEDYFVNYRMKREETRENSKAMLTPLRNSNVESVRKDAEEKWLALNTKNQQEDEIESMLKLRGFNENVVNIQPESVTVVVLTERLDSSQLKVIQDTVVRVCKMRLDKIIITTKS